MAFTYLVVAVILALFIIYWIIGLLMKKKYTISRNLFIKAPIDRVWETVTDIIRQIEWRKDLQKIEIKDDDGQNMVWMEIPKEGESILKKTIKKELNKIYEVEVVPTSIYTGSMKLEFSSSRAGTTLRITESIGVNNPLRRPFSKMSQKLEKHADQYQESLKSFLEEVKESTK